MTGRFMAALLAATALIPGAASAQNGDRAERREQRQEQRTQQRQAAEPGARTQRTPEQRAARQQRRAERAPAATPANAGNPGPRLAPRQPQREDARRNATRGDARKDNRGDRPNRGFDPNSTDYRDWLIRDNDDRRGNRERDRGGNWQNQNNGWQGDRNYRNDRGGYQNQRNWTRDWRQDRRYDWNRYRTSNRNAFRLPRYHAPSNWNHGYRRFSVGVTLGASLFGQNYWISDPYSYRLPPAYGSYRWVRYYDDALLVDLRSGRVVDVINGIFWR